MSARRPKIRDIALEVVWRAEREERFVDDELSRAYPRGLDRAERALLTEIVHGTNRWRGTLDHVIDRARDRGRIKPRLRWALRIALYQCGFLDAAEDRVAVSAAVDQAKRSFGRGGAGLANALLRRVLRDWTRERADQADPTCDVEVGPGAVWRGPAGAFPAEPAANLAARWSLPPWLAARWLDHFGAEAAIEIARAQNRRPGLHIVADPDLIGHVLGLLRAIGVEGEPRSDGVRIVRGAGRLLDSDLLARGELVVQDPAQAEVVPALAVSPGDDVLEIGAAPGTKTVALARAVGAEGRVVAVDRSPRRCAVLGEAVRRADLTDRVDVVCVDAAELPPRFRGRFARVLVDAPCSNTGVLARRSDARWRLGPGAIESLAARQMRMLAQGVAALAPGGRLVYATCSLEADENRGVVDAVLANPTLDTEIRLDAERATNPTGDHDGGYWARLLSAPSNPR